MDTFWNNAKAGMSGASLITRFDTQNFKTKFACQVKDFDPSLHLERNEIRKTDLFTQYGLYAASQAITDSNLNITDDNADEIGVIWGSGQGGMITFEEEYETFVKTGNPRFNPFFIPKFLNNMAAGMISLKFGLKGMSYSTVSACASANTAMMDAFNNIKLGKGVAYITGGSEAPISPSSMGGFNALRAMSTDNDAPEKASRPFDKTRNGFVMGEGAGAIILEEYEHAIARGAKIYAEVVATSMTSDAYHMTSSHPEGLGAAKAMKMALKEANLTPEDVDCINCHATSTPIGDTSEINAILNVFDKSNMPKLTGTKSMTGHLLGAAGAVESILSILSIKDNIIPPTINFSERDNQIPEYVEIVSEPNYKSKVNVVMSNTFGFGGHNAIVIFKKFEA
ncbi:MAG: 3-oxoacyl-[acyl-carrier-protein] synthase II [Parvicella sp.]